jgi:hypothetical protein
MAWLILTLVFVDEVLAIVATSIWGAHAGGWPLAVAAPLVTTAIWWAFASPKAPYGGQFVRPVAKVVVFGLASAGLLVAGHPGWALALIVFSILINACTQIRPEVAHQHRLDAEGRMSPG